MFPGILLWMIKNNIVCVSSVKLRQQNTITTGGKMLMQCQSFSRSEGPCVDKSWAMTPARCAQSNAVLREHNTIGITFIAKQFEHMLCKNSTNRTKINSIRFFLAAAGYLNGAQAASRASSNISAVNRKVCRKYWFKNQANWLEGLEWIELDNVWTSWKRENFEQINSHKGINMPLDRLRCKISTNKFNFPVVLSLVKCEEQLYPFWWMCQHKSVS